MYTDLMCPPRLQRKFAESIIPEAPEYTVMCNGLFSPGLYDSHLFPVLRISPDIALDRSGIVPDYSAYDAVINSRHRMYLELFGNLSVCRIILADDERTCRVFIDPVDDSRPQNAVNSRKALSAVIENCIYKSPVRVSRCRMYGHSLGLIDDKEVIILIKDVQRDRFGADLQDLRIRDPDLDFLPFHQFTAAFDRFSVY